MTARDAADAGIRRLKASVRYRRSIVLAVERRSAGRIEAAHWGKFPTQVGKIPVFVVARRPFPLIPIPNAPIVFSYGGTKFAS